MFRRATASALTAALALGAAACGQESRSKDETKATAASSEALYVDTGGLTYQVQLSRQLNPRDAEDSDYFRNLPAGGVDLRKGQVWFGVFLRVENQTKQALPSSREFTVTDTQGNVFRPLPNPNVFAYRPELVPADGFIPNPERLQAYAGTQGELLLFKLPSVSLNNRPLELAIKNPSDTRRSARIDLDV